MSDTKLSTAQEAVDQFYWTHGPCCAGCDWWQHFNSVAGECLAGPPVGEAERFAMLGITGCSLPSGAGHIVTPRDHECGSFADTYDWSSLPLAYRKRVGAGVAAPRAAEVGS